MSSTRRFRWVLCSRLLLVVLLACGVSSCTHAPAELSTEAKSAAYFKQLFGVIEEQQKKTSRFDEDNARFQREFASSADDRRSTLLKSWLADVLDPYLEALEQTRRQQARLQPPPNLMSFHQSLSNAMAKKVEIGRDIRNAIKAEDWGQLANKSDEEDALSEQLALQLRSGLKAAGFSSPEDIERTLQTPKKPMAWYWALILMAIVTGFGMWVIMMVFGLASFALIPLGLLSVKWEEAGKKGPSLAALVVTVAIAGFGVSIVGSAIAGYAEWFMFPRTELSPWFVHFVMGWTALGFGAGGDRDADRDLDGCATYSSCGRSLACLAGYLWATIAKGSLIGPWLWANQTVLNWLS